MVAHYTLTVYQADDVTPWFAVSTDPAHPHPYLHPPGEYDQGEIDLLGGRALVGEIQVRIIDPQTGADQSERWLTALLGIPAGQEGAGHSALNGRRGLLTQSDGTVVLDGVVAGARLSETFAGFHLGLRDIRERHRRVSLFGRTGTATVLPRGVLNGYGKLPNGDWLIPPTKPLPAVWHGSSGFFGQSGIFDLSGLWDGRPLDGSRTAKAPPSLVLTEAMRKVTSIAMVGDFVPMPVYRDVEVWWRRTSGDTSWHIITDIRPRGTSPHPLLLNHARARVEGVDGEVDAIHSIGVAGGGLGAPPLDVPNNGESVEVLILYVGPPTEDYPFHYEGTAGDLLAAIYDGTYSESPITDRVDAAALTALTTPVRLRLTEAPKADRSREWIEHVYRQLRAAPALDRSGRISPVTAALPDPSEVLVELTDDVCQPIPGWDHPATDAVTAVRITYPRDYRVPVEDDPLGVRSAGDGLASIDVIVERRAPEWVIDLMGEQVHEIDGFLFRALGTIGSAGTIDPASGDITDETGAREAVRAAREVLDRWVFGGQVSFARVSRAALPDLRAGQWVIDRRSWRPNYRELKRGGASLAQIMSVRALDPAWLEVSLVDAGPADQPLTAPTLGTPTASDDGIVTVPVTTVLTGGEAAIYYAVAASAPAWDSGAWRLAGRIGQAGDVHTPPQPAGAQVWITARAEGLGRRPSATTTPVSVTVPIVPRLHEVRIVLDGGTPTVHWQRNSVAQGVRIAYWIHSLEGDPTGPATTVDAAASELGHTLGVTVQPGQAITVEVTPYTGWTGSAVSGTPGPSVERSVARPREPEGPPGPPGLSVEIRYSGPNPGQNISGVFNPLLHLYMQVRREDESWPSQWARIVGEDGEPGVDGTYVDYRFRASAQQPDTPTGTNPSGWSDAPVEVPAGQLLWMTSARKDARTGALLGPWSEPVWMAGVGSSNLFGLWAQSYRTTAGEVIGQDRISDMRLEPGDVVSISARIRRASGSGVPQIFIDFRSGSSTIQTVTATSTTSEWARIGAEGLVIPAGTDTIRVRVPPPTGGGTVTVGEWMCNRGPVMLPYEDPAWRPSRGEPIPSGATVDDGAGPKLLPKGATSGFITNRGRVEFEQPYASAPIVILIPSTSFDSRDRWALTPAVADEGTGTEPMPSPAQIVMRATAQVTASGFEAFCRLIARGTPVQRQTSFAAPTTLSAIGSSSGAATPSSGQVPSLDDTYTAVFDVIVTNDYPIDTIDFSIQIALDVSMDTGAWVEAQVAWIHASVGPGQIVELFDQRITATAAGLEGGNDRFRLRIKDRIVIGPSGPLLSIQVNVKRLEWWQDSGARYASMTPGGTLDAVQFFVISQG